MKILTLIRKPIPYSMQNFTYGIIGINVLLFLFQQIAPALGGQMALFPPAVIARGYWWQLVTYMFVHASIGHLFFNMLALFFFGIAIERVLGSKEFLLFYLVCGVGAGIISLFGYILTNTNVYLVGASGAIYAVMLAFAALFPRSHIYVMGVIPVRAPILVLIFTFIAVVSQFSGRGNVSHLTHLAGFLWGFIYLLVRHRINAIRVFMNQ